MVTSLEVWKGSLSVRVDGSKGRMTKHSWHSAQTWHSAWISSKVASQGLCSLTQGRHLLLGMITASGHHHSCGFSAPACPRPLSASFLPASSPVLLLEQLCIIPSPLTSPFPNTPTCPSWFCASSWSVHSAKSNRCGWYWPARVSRLSDSPDPDQGSLSTGWRLDGLYTNKWSDSIATDSLCFLLVLQTFFLFLSVKLLFPFFVACFSV